MKNEMVLNGFSEVSEMELSDIDGGKWDNGDAVDIVMAVICTVAAVSTAIAATQPTPLSPALGKVAMTFAAGAIVNLAKVLD